MLRRRWCSEPRSRDLLGVPAATDSATMLKHCEERFEAYADHVYTTLSSSTVMLRKSRRADRLAGR
jgi:Protein ChrB, N-terminal